MKMTGIWTSMRAPADIQRSFDFTTPELAALVFGAEPPSPLLRRGDAPYRVAHVVRHQQGAALVDHDTHGTPHRIAVLFDEAGQHVDRLAGGGAAGEGHEDDFVAAARLAVPGAVLPHEHPAAEPAGQGGSFR